MPRKREGSITESPQQLESLLQTHAGDTCEPRLRMLLYLSTRPAATINEVASAIDCSERTVRRWWKAYQDGGLKGLTGIDGGRRSALSPAVSADAAPLVPRHLATFLNALPLIDDTIDWINRFREALQRLLGDVDRISVSVDTQCRLYHADQNTPQLLVAQHVRDAASRGPAAEVTTHRIDRPPGELLVHEMAHGGFPCHDYHPPSCFDYVVPNGSYLGTIILWRRANAPEISQRTLRTMRELEPFLIFLLSDCVERRRRDSQNLADSFVETLSTISTRHGLTQREQQVLVHTLMGQSHQEIMKHLSISINTLRKHIKSIFRKVGVGNFRELVARYFTPLEE